MRALGRHHPPTPLEATLESHGASLWHAWGPLRLLRGCLGSSSGGNSASRWTTFSMIFHVSFWDLAFRMTTHAFVIGFCSSYHVSKCFFDSRRTTHSLGSGLLRLYHVSQWIFEPPRTKHILLLGKKRLKIQTGGDRSAPLLARTLGGERGVPPRGGERHPVARTLGGEGGERHQVGCGRYGTTRYFPNSRLFLPGMDASWRCSPPDNKTSNELQSWPPSQSLSPSPSVFVYASLSTCVCIYIHI